MTSDVIQICTMVLSISFTALIAVGSFAIICGIITVLLGKDID